MSTLSAYSNIENTSLLILYKKGFRVWYIKKTQLYYAERNGWDFAANSITELLGLVSIYEFHAPENYVEYWWRINDEWLIDDIPTIAPEYDPVWEK
nr:hypothetical protein [uncultured Desulfobacter sp.]